MIFLNLYEPTVLQMDQIRPLFVYLCSFHMTNKAQIDNNDTSVNGVLGTRTRGGRMVGADEYTELWRHPKYLQSYAMDKSLKVTCLS